jgi:hypothetical protein
MKETFDLIDFAISIKGVTLFHHFAASEKVL